MIEKYLIVHSDIAEEILSRINPKDRHYNSLFVHVETIKKVRTQERTVELSMNESPRTTGCHFQKDDVVSIYGLWKDNCIKAAKESLDDNGIS